MINTLRRAAALLTSTAALFFTLTMPSLSQAPTDAQRSAIRAECRSDYEAHCASVPPGGAASLQCLQKNTSSLSPGCQSAVRAVEPAAEPKTEPKAESAPAVEPAKPTAETAVPPPATENTAPGTPTSPTARKPDSAQIAAIRSACRSDYQRNCAGVPTGGPAALQCLEKNKANLSPNCQRAVNAASGGGAPPATARAPSNAAPAAPGTAPAAAPAPALVLRQMRPREIIFVLRSACGGDVRSLCGDVPAGGGRIIQCLAAQAGSLSPACADVLSQFAAQ